MIIWIEPLVDPDIFSQPTDLQDDRAIFLCVSCVVHTDANSTNPSQARRRLSQFTNAFLWKAPLFLLSNLSTIEIYNA